MNPATAPPGAASAIGAQITIPTVFLSQAAGPQEAPILNSRAVFAETDFYMGLPAPARTKLPPAETRVFRQRAFDPASVFTNGQDNGLPTTDPGYHYRQSIDTTVTATTNSGLEQVQVRYSGGNGFSGTMAALVNGSGRLFVAGPVIDNLFPSSLHPVVGSAPIGNPASWFRIHNGAGWDYTVMEVRPAGTFKAFPSNPSVIGTPCLATLPPSPSGCNEISGFDSNGIALGAVAGGTSTRHMFAWTTGTVSIVTTAVRSGVVNTYYLTAMGHDVVGTNASGAPERNIGLVAGSYTVRGNPITGATFGSQIVGVNIKLTPEPGATVALICGLGMLGMLAVRRKR